MAGGWAKDGAVQDQIDATVEDAVARARSRLAGGESRTECEACDAPIPEARRAAMPGVRRCVACQGAAEAGEADATPVNRRASKDSLLR